MTLAKLKESFKDGAYRMFKVFQFGAKTAAECSPYGYDSNPNLEDLDAIFSETQAEEEQLKILSTALSKEVDGRLLQAYQRIRKSSRNGLVVVPIHRQASLGSYILIPPQRQIEVANRNKIIVDEHSGRILIDMELAEEQKQYVSELLKKANISSEIHL